ncbi:MAG: DUF1816 domain-containing protein [Chroococcidiopsidaceae cyanobacterium CP_BM_ER_R8_30]|nr:DUF1816 domain-containing protein [Chroococcidiopsidaceae cyanobacterium CP_BM_ER_R8_30]
MTMKLLEVAQEPLTSTLDWWVEIVTQKPKCTYFFGPFVCAKEAELAIPGYVEDLEQESVQGIAIESKQCQPTELTICEDEF